jgi:hypothetical protein
MTKIHRGFTSKWKITVRTICNSSVKSDSETGTAGKDERCADSNAPVEAGPHGLMDDG